MSKEKPSIWLIIVSLLMLFVSGAWTLATITPFWITKDMRTVMLITVTAANVSFLVTLLTAMLLYMDVNARESLRRIMKYAFVIGILVLIISIILFSASYLIAPPPHFPD